MDELIQAIIDLKTLARKHLLKRSATFHAIDIVEKIAGWELASLLGSKFDLFKKIKQIYQEELDKMKG